jgi:hypothetical protein
MLVHISQPTYGIMRKVAFLTALDRWSNEPKPAFSMSRPPVDSLPDETCDENAELASVFYRMTRQKDLAGQMAVLAFDILVHERRHDLAWNQARGQRNPRARADRTDWVNLKPYKEMLDVLHDWSEALHQRACEVE